MRVESERKRDDDRRMRWIDRIHIRSHDGEISITGVYTGTWTDSDYAIVQI
jgi:hypothetical protein